MPRAGSESTVYEARLGGERVAAKKPVLSTSDDLDKFHYQLQLLWWVLPMFVPLPVEFLSLLSFGLLMLEMEVSAHNRWNS